MDTNEALINIKSQENKDPIFSSMAFSPIYHDPGCRREIMSDEDRMYMIKQGPFQPKLATYPRNSNIPTPKHCHFSSEWFNSYPHLDYSIKKDAAFCFVCPLFSINVSQRIHGGPSAAWTLNGVQSWYKMKSHGKEKKKTGKLAAHFTSSNHQEALNALLAFQNKSTHIDMLLDKDCRKALIEKEAKTQRNREAIKALLDVARSLGCQGISFRGSSNEKDGNGNFRLIVSLVSRHSSSLKRWLDDTEIVLIELTT